jgi:hypothetical protein
MTIRRRDLFPFVVAMFSFVLVEHDYESSHDDVGLILSVQY